MPEYELLSGYSRVEGERGRVFYKKGDIIEADPDSIRQFTDVFKPLIPEPEIKESFKPSEPVKPKVLAVHKGRGKWQVVDSITGIAIHEGFLDKGTAKDLAKMQGVVISKTKPDDSSSDSEKYDFQEEKEEEVTSEKLEKEKKEKLKTTKPMKKAAAPAGRTRKRGAK